MMLNKLKSIVFKTKYEGAKRLESMIFHFSKIAGRFIFPVYFLLNAKKYIYQTSYYPESPRKSSYKIFFELFFYALCKGELNTNYFIFGFDQKSKNDFKEYIPWFTYSYKRNKLNQFPPQSYYDYYNYICLLRDKFVFEAFCKGTGISTPQNFGMIQSGKIFYSKEKSFIPFEKIVDFELDCICKKNVSYGGGMPNDILSLKIKGGVISLNNNQINLSEFKTIMSENQWIIQVRLTNQSPGYSCFHSTSINTIRVVTIKMGSKIEVVRAFFRMGVNGTFTDNWSSGGICCGVNIENGKLEKWGLFKPGLGTKSDHHPNSKIIFENYELPQWYEITQLVINAHHVFYGLHSIGWDVAVTTDGIVLIEGNDNWDTIDMQLSKGSRADYEKYFN